MKVPAVPMPREAEAYVKFCVHFVTLEGFISVYNQLLTEHKQPWHAYEATEQLHNYFFSRRRFADKEAFYNTKSQYHRRKGGKK